MALHKFVKYTGAGNDFVLFDTPAFELKPETISRLCDRRFGIGADGVLVIKDAEGFDFTMEYYNANGSTGSLCGNGARCALKYVFTERLPGKPKVKFTCNGEKYSGDLLEEGLVKFYLNSPEKIATGKVLEISGRVITYSYADTGSPHVVIKREDITGPGVKAENFGNPSLLRTEPAVEQTGESEKALYKTLDEIPVYELGKAIRHSDKFPGGTNVNFIGVAEDKVYIRTYERGVEDETLACGTGATASAIIAGILYGKKSPVEIVTKSGISLYIGFNKENDNFTNVTLTGPAEEVFKGEVNF